MSGLYSSSSCSFYLHTMASRSAGGKTEKKCFTIEEKCGIMVRLQCGKSNTKLAIISTIWENKDKVAFNDNKLKEYKEFPA